MMMDWNLSIFILTEESAKQLVSYVKNLMDNLQFDSNAACTALGITEEMYQQALELQEEE